MKTLTQFEKYNENNLGAICLIAPGLINSNTSKEINRLNGFRDSKIILLSYTDDYSINTFIELCIKLEKEGYFVVIEFNHKIFQEIKQRGIQYIGIILNDNIIETFRIDLEKIYSEMENIYLNFYFDKEEIYKINHLIKKHSNRILELMSPQYNIRQAISEYEFMKKNYYKYI